MLYPGSVNSRHSMAFGDERIGNGIKQVAL